MEKIFLMLYSINLTNFVVWLSLTLEIFGNMCIAIVCFSGFDFISFEINLIFLIKVFFYILKNARQKCKNLENGKSFSGEIKSIFHHYHHHHHHHHHDFFHLSKFLLTRKCAFNVNFLSNTLTLFSTILTKILM